MVGKELKRDDIHNSLKGIGSRRHADRSVVLEEGRVIVFVADNNGIALSGRDLLESTFSVLDILAIVLIEIK